MPAATVLLLKLTKIQNLPIFLAESLIYLCLGNKCIDDEKNVILCLISSKTWQKRHTGTGLILKGAAVVSKIEYTDRAYGFKRAVARSKSKASPPPHTVASLLQLPTRLLGPTCPLLDSLFPDQDFVPLDTHVMTPACLCMNLHPGFF